VSAQAPTGDLLGPALAAARPSSWSAGRYSFTPVASGTQASVWRGVPDGAGLPQVAVRLTPKPAALIERIASLVDGVEVVCCPRTLAVASLQAGERIWTVQVCTWIGTGAADRGAPYRLGQDIAALHQQLAAGGYDFTDRKLSFERGPIPSVDQELPAWYVARYLWRDRVLPQFAGNADRLPRQPIHGDLHWANVVGTGGGFGFIDFDKLMHASRAFDLAKLIATGFFHIGEKDNSGAGGGVRFQRGRASDLLAGYESVSPLRADEVAAIEGFAVILNEEIARLGHAYDVPAYQEQADAVGGWWTRRRRRDPHNPLGLRPADASPQRSPAGPPHGEVVSEQLALAIDDL
jgi:hypothetical protein